MGIGHFVFGPEPSNDRESAQETSPSVSRINAMMNGITEPATKWYGVLVWLCPCFLCVAAIHWSGAVDPALEEEYGAEGVKLLLYNGYVRSVVGGMPDWAFASIFWFLCATVSGVCAAYSWGTDAIEEKKPEVPEPEEMEKVTSVSSVHVGVAM